MNSSPETGNESHSHESNSHLADLLKTKWPVGIEEQGRIRIGYNLETPYGDRIRIRIRGRLLSPSVHEEKDWVYTVRYIPRRHTSAFATDSIGETTIQTPRELPHWFKVIPGAGDEEIMSSAEFKEPDIHDSDKWLPVDPSDLQELYSALSLARELPSSNPSTTGTQQ